jgi:hypothetical protein
MAEEHIKEVFLTSSSLKPDSMQSSSVDYKEGTEGALVQREKRRRRRTRKVYDEIQTQDAPVKMETVVVEKTSKQKPIIVLAPPRKKTARILLVSSKTIKNEPKKFTDRRKTFRAKRVTVTIDNTAKTAKRKNLLMKQVDGLTEEQLREAVITAKLARRESVAKVPEKLLRQMLKDYQSIRGAYV